MVQTKIEAIYPPDALLAKVDDPYRPVTTTGEVIQALADYQGAFGVCTAQLDGVRNWVKTTKDGLKPAVTTARK